MPLMDGLTATKRLRETFDHSALPVIGLTADFRKSDLSKYKDIGMNDCIGKPVRLAELKESILAAIGGVSRDNEESGQNVAICGGSEVGLQI